MLSRDIEAYDEYCERTAPSDDYAGPRAACTHPLVEVLSVNGRNLDGAVRQCAYCGERVEQPKRIPADPRLAAIADQLAESILATLAAHGYAIVREADTQGYSAERHAEFAREAARNAVGILGMEGGL